MKFIEIRDPSVCEMKSNEVKYIKFIEFYKEINLYKLGSLSDLMILFLM